MECSDEVVWRKCGFPPANVSYLDEINKLGPSLLNFILYKNYGNHIGNAMRRLAWDRATKTKTDVQIKLIIGRINRASMENPCAGVDKTQICEAFHIFAGLDDPSAGVDDTVSEESDDEYGFDEKVDAECDPCDGNYRCVIVEEKVTEVVTRSLIWL